MVLRATPAFEVMFTVADTFSVAPLFLSQLLSWLLSHGPASGSWVHIALRLHPTQSRQIFRLNSLR